MSEVRLEQYFSNPSLHIGKIINFSGKLGINQNQFQVAPKQIYKIQLLDRLSEQLHKETVHLLVEDTNTYANQCVLDAGNDKIFDFECEIMEKAAHIHYFKLIKLSQPSNVFNSQVSNQNSTFPSQLSFKPINPISSDNPIQEQQISNDGWILPGARIIVPISNVQQNHIKIGDYIKNPAENIRKITTFIVNIGKSEDHIEAGFSGKLFQTPQNLLFAGQLIEQPMNILVDKQNEYLNQFLLFEGSKQAVEIQCEIMGIREGQHYFKLASILDSILPKFVATWKLTDFQKIKKIGHGQFGQVLHMREIETSKEVAIKECDYQKPESKLQVNKEVSIMVDICNLLQQQDPYVLKLQQQQQQQKDLYQYQCQQGLQSASSIQSTQEKDKDYLHVVEPLGFFLNEEKDSAYLVMEFCDVGDLRNFMNQLKNKKEKISVEKAIQFTKQIASSLIQLHQHGIIHGDLKPENILLTKDQQVKLADFGLARKLELGKLYTLAVGGTFLYQAPELLFNNSVLSKQIEKVKQKSDEEEEEDDEEEEEEQEEEDIEEKNKQNQKETIDVDVWAFGTVMFELLAQRHPFFTNKNITPSEFIQKVLTHPPAKLPSMYPDQLKNIIMRMLEKNPNNRISASEVLVELDDLELSMKQ